MNDNIIATTTSATVEANQSSQTVFIHCETGARVYIQCGPNHSCQFRNDLHHDLPTFAGFLVAADA